MCALTCDMHAGVVLADSDQQAMTAVSPTVRQAGAINDVVASAQTTQVCVFFSVISFDSASDIVVQHSALTMRLLRSELHDACKCMWPHKLHYH